MPTKNLETDPQSPTQKLRIKIPARAEAMEKRTKTEQGKYSLYTRLTLLITYLSVPAQATIMLSIVVMGKAIFLLKSVCFFKTGGECLHEVSNADAKLVSSDPPKEGVKEYLYVWSVCDICLSVCLLSSSYLVTYNFRFQNHPT